MNGADDQKLRFRPRARIIRTIGDQLISGPEAAVIELVKNAYDADASYVWIRFVPPLTFGTGRISIVDDGHGMSLIDVRDKWMEPATTAKVGTRLSPKGRVLMGSKGIGRFAVAKLGRKFGLNSVSEHDGLYEEVLIPEIDWAIFNSDTYLSDIAIDFLLQPSNGPTRTEIEIRELTETWPESKIARLHLELRRLVSPLDKIQQDSAFRIYLDLAECTLESAGFDGASIVGATGTEPEADRAAPPAAYQVQPFPLLTTSDYEISGAFDEAGTFGGTMQIHRAGQAPAPIELNAPLADDELPCGRVGVHFFIFDREAIAIRQTMARAGLGYMNATEAREILDKIAGVAIYRDGFRVRPYGDAENDWLTLDRRRVQDPSQRIGHNQIAGFVTVQDQAQSDLVERSSREGFEQNAAFHRLRRLITKLLTEQIEPRRLVFREKTGLSRPRNTTFEEVRQLSGLQRIRQIVDRLPLSEQAGAQKVIERESAQLAEKIAVLEERQRILEAQSSLGAILGEVLHEGGPAVAYLSNTTNLIQRLYGDVLAGGERAEQAKFVFPDRLSNMKKNATRLADLFKALRPLAGGRRGEPSLFRPADPIFAAAAIFETHETKIDVEGGLEAPRIEGYPDDLMTAMVNLFGNSVFWLEESHTPVPKIDVRLFTQNSELVIYVDDNGPGITPEFAENIFDVGFSLKPNGTGLGLNIAREALARSGGKLAYHLDHKDGTRFEIRFAVPARGT